MFDFTHFDARQAGAAIQPPATAQTPPAGPEVSHRSLLYWCEHCVECAAPACYRSCDLYEPRRDGHCRRFAYGIRANRNFGGAAEIAFRKWAKLESAGSVRMHRAGRLRVLERGLGLAAALLNLLGRSIWRLSGDLRWTRAAQALAARLLRHYARPAAIEPHGFLLEVYNPGPAEAALQLAIRLDPHSAPRAPLPPFQAEARLPVGYSRHFFDAANFRSITHCARPWLVSLTPEADSSPTLVLLAADFVVARLDNEAPPVKCIVWDLDGTVWDGVLAESADVRLRPHIAELLATLDRRGILHSVASKNDAVAAWSKLEELGLAEYFLAPEIGWNPKSDSLRAIAQRLNLCQDSFVFTDDNPFERAEVATALPQVTCLDAPADTGWLTLPRFQGSDTEEARSRRSLYRAAAERDRQLEASPGDYVSFVASCAIELQVDDYQPADFDRVAELLQRTNQLNFSGRHYARDDVRRLVADPAWSKLVLRCQDRFGSYGAVGFAIVRTIPDGLLIEDFMLSCRVQAKFIEQAFFASLRAHAGPGTRVIVNFSETGRNKPARGVLESLRFQPRSTGGMELAPEEPLECDFIRVAWGAGRPAQAASLEGQPV